MTHLGHYFEHRTSYLGMTGPLDVKQPCGRAPDHDGPCGPHPDSPWGIAGQIAADLCARGYAPEHGMEPWIEAIALAITAERQRHEQAPKTFGQLLHGRG